MLAAVTTVSASAAAGRASSGTDGAGALAGAIAVLAAAAAGAEAAPAAELTPIATSFARFACADAAVGDGTTRAGALLSSAAMPARAEPGGAR